MILILMLYVFLAATFTIGKMLLFFLPPFFLTAVRMTLAGTMLLFFWKITQAGSKSFKIHDIATLLGLSVIHILIPYSAEFVALQSISPACAALMFNLTPFFSAFFSYIYFKERMTLNKWIGFLIGFSGIGWFVYAESYGNACWDFNSAYPLMLLAVISGAWGWVYFRKLALAGYSPFLINGTAMLFAGMQSYFISKLIEGTVTFDWSQLGQFLFLLMTIIMLANILFYNLYGYLLKKYTATLLSFVGCFTPLFTAVFDYLFLGSSVDIVFIISIIMVSFGIYMFYKEELRQGYILGSSKA